MNESVQQNFMQYSMMLTNSKFKYQYHVFNYETEIMNIDTESNSFIPTRQVEK